MENKCDCKCNCRCERGIPARDFICGMTAIMLLVGVIFFLLLAKRASVTIYEPCVLIGYEETTSTEVDVTKTGLFTAHGRAYDVTTFHFTVQLEDGRIINNSSSQWNPEVKEVGSHCTLESWANYGNMKLRVEGFTGQ